MDPCQIALQTDKQLLAIHTQTNMNDAELFQLKENYINMIIDGMDVDSLCQLAYDLLLDSYQDCTEDQMIEEIKDLYDEETLVDLIPEKM